MTVGEHGANLVGTLLNTVRERLRSRLLNKSFRHAHPEELSAVCTLPRDSQPQTWCWKILPGCTNTSASHLVSICGYRAWKLLLTISWVCLAR